MRRQDENGGRWWSRTDGNMHAPAGFSTLLVLDVLGDWVFYYVNVLSHFAQARRDSRFKEVFDALAGKADAQGHLVVASPHRSRRRYSFARVNRPSEVATEPFAEIKRLLAVE